MDNFFTTLPLAELLMTWKLSLTGTLRKNKTCIPKEMLPNKDRAIQSTMFGFVRNVAISSYVPKQNKAVVLLSTQHYTTVVSGTANKPLAILDYNRSKAGVDIMDKMLGEYSTKRATRRWPLAFFFNMVDVACLAAYIIYTENNSLKTKKNIKKSIRRSFLLELVDQMTASAIQERSQSPKICGNFKKRIAIESMLGGPIQMPVRPSEPAPREKDGRLKYQGVCYQCNSGPQKLRRRTRKCCSKCNRPICDQHTSTTTQCYCCIQIVPPAIREN